MIKQFLKTRLSEILHDPYFIWTTRINLFFLLPAAAILLINWRRLPPQLPLYYSLPWGEEQLATPTILLSVFLSTVFVSAGNLVCVFFVRSVSQFYTRIVFVVGTFYTLLTVVTIIKIVLLIT